MKKTFLILALAFALILSACGKENGADDSSHTTSFESVITREDNAYLDIVPVDTESFREEYFSLSNSNFLLKLSLPSDWELKPNGLGGGYAVYYDGNAVGVIMKGTPGDDGWKTVRSAEEFSETAKVDSYIQRQGMGEQRVFRYKFVYTIQNQGTPETITAMFTYQNVGENIAANLNKVDKKDITKITKFGTLSDIKDGNYIILGNSFVGSSEVATVLQNMFEANGVKAKVEGQSRGYATVSTYAYDSALMARIEQGDFDAVFLCGFYSDSEINALDAIITACEKSKTRLVLFPAHNENRFTIDKAAAHSESVTLLDWKGEIDILINSGVAPNEMYVNDQHRHSTVMAGYVGAHMIYRSVYGAVPAKGITTPTLPQSKVDSVLGTYVKKGFVNSRVGVENIYFL